MCRSSRRKTTRKDEKKADSLEALALVSQGVTTIAAGADGGRFSSPLSELFGSLEETPAAVNVAAFSGHNRVRLEVMGSDFKRPATTEEITAMSSLVEAEMEAGALGLSTGLEYES